MMMHLPLLDLDPMTKWAVIVLAILTIVYAAVRPLIRKKDPLMKPPAYARLSQQRSVEKHMQNVLVELSEMARQISAQLDTRAAKLEALIRDADQRIAAMKSPQSSAEMVATGAASSQQEAFRGESTEQPMIDPRHALVYALADQGRSCKDIAQELNRPSGEIELILALRR
jgi:hypothetical protein